MKSKSYLQNQRGQTLIEYLIIIALVGVGSIAIMRSVGNNLNAKFAGVIHAMGGNVSGNRTAEAVKEGQYKKRDLKDFAKGAVSPSKRAGGGSDDASESSE